LNPNPTFEKKMSAVGSVADTSRDGDATDWRLQQHWMLQLFSFDWQSTVILQDVIITYTQASLEMQLYLCP